MCGPFGTEITIKDYQRTGIPLLRISNITGEGTIDETDLVFLNPMKASRLSSTQVRPNDLVISQRGTLGMPAVIPPSYPVWNISANLIAIRNVQELLPAFLQMFLSTRAGAFQLERTLSGQVQGKITTDDVASVLVPRLPQLVQNEMVAEMEKARDSRRRKLEHADALLSGLDTFIIERLGLIVPAEQENRAFVLKLSDLMGRRMDAPAYKPFFAKGQPPKTPVQPLSSLAEINPPMEKKHYDDTILVPYVGLPECDLTEIREVTMRPYSEVKGRNAFKAGDILFARIEPSVFNKKFILAEDLQGHEFAFTSTEFYVVRPSSDVDRFFLYSMFFCSFVFAQIRGKTTGSSGRRRIDPELFADLMVPVPPKPIRDQIAQEMMHHRMEVRRLRIEAEHDWSVAKAIFDARLLGEEPSQ